MPLWLRRTIYLAFIALFLIIAPLLALYSMGYRYHWAKRTFERTGLIVVDGVPTDATVTLDDDARTRGFPARIGGLPANEYLLRVTRDGFRPWESRVTVASGRTTFATNLRLFREADPALLLAGDITAFTVSANRRWAAFLRSESSAKELWLLNLTTGTPTLALRLTRQPTTQLAIAWSPRDALLLVTTTDHGTSVMNPEMPDARFRVDTLLTNPALTAFQWEIGSSAALIAIRGDRLVRVNLATRRATPLPVTRLQATYAVGRGTRYTATANQLLAQSIETGTTRTVATFPTSAAIGAFVDLEGSVLTAVNTTRDAFLRIELTTGRWTLTPGLARMPAPRSSRDILWRTANELAIASEDREPMLLERRAAPFVDAVWHPEGTHVIAATSTDIAAIARSDATLHRVMTLARFDAIAHITVTTDGRALAIVARHGNTTGLWMLVLE